jgi:AcrR family transcriptional regulator
MFTQISRFRACQLFCETRLFIEMKKEKRRYVLKARGEHMVETRARIVDALVQLHQEVGPGRTTISAVAERAGVERLTVYRHFPDDAAMLAACSHRYYELHPPPDPSTWVGEADPRRRTRRGLEELYAFFGRTAPMFEKVYRDVEVSAPVKQLMGQFDAYLCSVADGLAAAWPRDKTSARRQTILRHATKFATWQSFEADGVDDAHKVALLLDWLAG